MIRATILLLLFSLSVFAAPIPKSLKAKKPLDITGMWKIVGHNTNGNPVSHDRVVQFWAFTENSFQYYTDPNTKQGNQPTILTTPDSDRPQQKKMHEYPCFIERDGDQMRWVYTTDVTMKLEDCEPGKGRNLYIFEFVK